MPLPPVYIFDLDGTLSDSSHRAHIIQEKTADKWDRFSARAHLDPPIENVIQILDTLHEEGSEIWIWTGRADNVRAETVKWLHDQTCLYEGDLDKPNALRMRPRGDHTPDTALKQDWLKSLSPEDRKRIVAVFEDRTRMIEMWRANGLTALQVAPGDF
jgi:hypothetical protein